MRCVWKNSKFFNLKNSDGVEFSKTFLSDNINISQSGMDKMLFLWTKNVQHK